MQGKRAGPSGPAPWAPRVASMSDENLYAEYLEQGTASPRAAEVDPATREELDTLRDALGDVALWTDPPPELADAVLAGILDARAADDGDGDGVVATVTPLRRE